MKPWNGAIAPLECPECGNHSGYSPDAVLRGCTACAARRVATNYVCQPPDPRLVAHTYTHGGDATRTGIWRWSAAFPIDAKFEVSLGEGNTPLLLLDRITTDLNIRALYGKNEAANPTWSHKDRLCSMIVALAKATNAPGVTAATTGNHGSALAAYAAKAGVPCKIFTLASASPIMLELMQAYDAEVVVAKDHAERYELLHDVVDSDGWLPASNGVTPAIGSNPYGVAGYKSIAYELLRQLDGLVPDAIVVPVAYGDCLAGIQHGFEDLQSCGAVSRIPKLVGVSVSSVMVDAMAGSGVYGPFDVPPTTAFSIATSYATRQAVRAVQTTRGCGVVVSEDALQRAIVDLGAHEGLYVESASATTVAAVRELSERGYFSQDDTVVCMLTSAGFKRA